MTNFPNPRKIAHGLLAILALLTVVAEPRAQSRPSVLRGWGDVAFSTEGRDGIYTKVAADQYTSAVLRSDGQIFVNGDNWASVARVPQLAPGRRYVDFDISWRGGAAIVDDGSIVVWGGEFNSSLPPPWAVATYPPAPALPAGLAYVQVTCGDQHVLALRSDGALVAWGNNYWGQCNVPALQPGQSVVQIEAKVETNWLVLSDGSILTFGRVFASQIAPQLPPGVGYVAFSAGLGVHLAVRSDGEVQAWGSNTHGELNVPALPSGMIYTGVAGGWGHSTAIRSDGSIVHWGTNSVPPPPLPPGVTCVQLAAGDHQNLALLSNGKILAWNRNDFFESYIPSRSDISLGSPLAQLVDIAAGYGHATAVTSEGRLIAWGTNQYGQSSIPAFFGGYTFRRVAASILHSVALTDTGQVLAWGNNNNGRASIPPLPSGVTYVDFACGDQHTILVRSDGQASFCGPNQWGEGNIPSLPPGVTYSACDAHEGKSVLLRSDGQIVSFGLAYVPSEHVAPALPLGLRYTDLGAGAGFNTAIRSDGTAHIWGSVGTTGTALAGLRPIPILPFGIYYVEADGGYRHASLRRSDGRIEVVRNVYLTMNAVPELDPGTSYVQINSGQDTVLGRVAAESTYVGFAQGCAGSRPSTRLVPRDTPKIGRTMEVTLFDLPVDIAFLAMGWSRITPLSLASLGMPGCDLQISPDAVGLLVGQTNQARWFLPIPDQPSLLGVRFYNQALVLDPQAPNSFGAVLSDAAEGVVGDR
jgi:alpha-tubulin suppressor-like RCC1 family protein